MAHCKTRDVGAVTMDHPEQACESKPVKLAHLRKRGLLSASCSCSDVLCFTGRSLRLLRLLLLCEITLIRHRSNAQVLHTNLAMKREWRERARSLTSFSGPETPFGPWLTGEREVPMAEKAISTLSTVGKY